MSPYFTLKSPVDKVLVAPQVRKDVSLKPLTGVRIRRNDHLPYFQKNIKNKRGEYLCSKSKSRDCPKLLLSLAMTRFRPRIVSITSPNQRWADALRVIHCSLAGSNCRVDTLLKVPIINIYLYINEFEDLCKNLIPNYLIHQLYESGFFRWFLP